MVANERTVHKLSFDTILTSVGLTSTKIWPLKCCKVWKKKDRVINVLLFLRPTARVQTWLKMFLKYNVLEDKPGLQTPPPPCLIQFEIGKIITLDFQNNECYLHFQILFNLSLFQFDLGRIKLNIGRIEFHFG